MWHTLSMIPTMILIQVFIMPFVMVNSVEDVYFSMSQGYMGAFMGTAMVVVDGLVWHSLPWWVWILTVAFGVAAVVGFRAQVGIGDREYLRDMIPHHSMAILTSKKRLDSPDNRVTRLAEEIIITQKREIAQMRFMLNHGV